MGVPGQDNTLHGYLLRWSTSHHHNVHNTQQHTPPHHPLLNITRFKPHTLVCRYFPIRHILSVSKVAAQEALILTCSRSSMIYQIYSGQFGSQSTCCNVVMLPLDFATYVTIVRKLDIWSCSECSVALIWCLSPIRILESWTQQSHSKERRNRNSWFWFLAVTRAATTVGIVIGTFLGRAFLLK